MGGNATGKIFERTVLSCFKKRVIPLKKERVPR